MANGRVADCGQALVTGGGIRAHSRSIGGVQSDCANGSSQVYTTNYFPSHPLPMMAKHHALNCQSHIRNRKVCLVPVFEVDFVHSVDLVCSRMLSRFSQHHGYLPLHFVFVHMELLCHHTADDVVQQLRSLFR